MHQDPQQPTTCQPVVYPDPLPNIIPFGGISLLAGCSGIGKTALMATLARNFRDNRPIFGHQPSVLPGIGVVNVDRNWARGGAGLWFERAGYADVKHYSMIDDVTFNSRCLRKKFERTQRLAEFFDRLELPPGSLIFVDPIGMFLGGNLLSYDDCAVSCCEIREALRARSFTVLATAHAGKLKSDRKERYLRLQDSVLGSTAIFGFSDTQLYLASPEETGEPYYTFMWNSHMAKPEVFYLQRDEQGLFVPYDGADQGNCGRVLLLFPDDGAEVEWKTLKGYASSIPLSEATLKRVLGVLIDRGRVEKPRHRFYRKLPLF